jgi:hypothetical protein
MNCHGRGATFRVVEKLSVEQLAEKNTTRCGLLVHIHAVFDTQNMELPQLVNTGTTQ